MMQNGQEKIHTVFLVTEQGNEDTEWESEDTEWGNEDTEWESEDTEWESEDTEWGNEERAVWTVCEVGEHTKK